MTTVVFLLLNVPADDRSPCRWFRRLGHATVLFGLLDDLFHRSHLTGFVLLASTCHFSLCFVCYQTHK